MATKTRPVAPVAGTDLPSVAEMQLEARKSAYRLDSESPEQVGVEVLTSEPKRVEKKAPRQAATPTNLTARDASGLAMYEWLISTEITPTNPFPSGTPPEKLKFARAWLNTNPNATAAEFCERLLNSEDMGEPAIAFNTLRKAGKWVYGDMWEPESAAFHSPNDELLRARQEIANLQMQAKIHQSNAASLQQQIKYLTEQSAMVASQRDYLKMGRSPEDLHAMGLAAAQPAPAAQPQMQPA